MATLSGQNKVSFPLYHGSSSLYLDAFQVGQTPGAWPHKETALGLLRAAWAALRQHGEEPEWWVQRVLDQATGHANWRHGAFYVTPSKLSAVRYADGGSKYGGELLTLCHEAVCLVRRKDLALARVLTEKVSPLSRFLQGGGEPILVELGDLSPEDLLPEREDRDVIEMLQLLEEDETYRATVGQQLNFAVKPGAGSVRKRYRVQGQSSGDPLTPFQLDEIR